AAVVALVVVGRIFAVLDLVGHGGEIEPMVVEVVAGSVGAPAVSACTLGLLVATVLLVDVDGSGPDRVVRVGGDHGHVEVVVGRSVHPPLPRPLRPVSVTVSSVRQSLLAVLVVAMKLQVLPPAVGSLGMVAGRGRAASS
ncbi:MAG: hypothetical protein O7C56_09725, partial [Rickettsia endosymbiont of Ixodes persulcatus]|nr:hypothetical protein [Rickettsia endosymbiont of Ixodes persulcatus]